MFPDHRGVGLFRRYGTNHTLDGASTAPVPLVREGTCSGRIPHCDENGYFDRLVCVGWLTYLGSEGMESWKYVGIRTRLSMMARVKIHNLSGRVSTRLSIYFALGWGWTEGSVPG